MAHREGLSTPYRRLRRLFSGDVRTCLPGTRTTTFRNRAALVPHWHDKLASLNTLKLSRLQKRTAELRALAPRRYPVEDGLLPEMCNCGCSDIRITWQSIN